MKPEIKSLPDMFVKTVSKLKKLGYMLPSNGGYDKLYMFAPDKNTQLYVIKFTNGLDTFGLEVNVNVNGTVQLSMALASKSGTVSKVTAKLTDIETDELDISVAKELEKLRTGLMAKISTTASQKATSASKKPVKKETPKHPELPGLESASAALIKLKRTVSSEPEFFKYFSKASGIYMDAISGSVPSFEDVSEALMDVNTELKQVTDPNVAKHGKIFFEAFRDFRNSYKEWLMNNNNTTASQKALASEKVWIAASPKGGNVSDPVATKALEKYIKEFGKRGKLRLYEAYRENGMAVYKGDCKSFKGTLQEIIDQLKQEAIAQAKDSYEFSKAEQAEVKKLSKLIGLDVKSMLARPERTKAWLAEYKKNGTVNNEKVQASVVVAEETYSNKAAGQIYGDVKAIAAKLKSWKKSMTKEEYAQYEAYQKGVLKYILTNVLSKLPEEYQTKIKAI
jgi:hypothetical protein